MIWQDDVPSLNEFVDTPRADVVDESGHCRLAIQIYELALPVLFVSP